METRRVRRHRRPQHRARARHLDLSVISAEGTAVVRVEGELDLASAGRLRDYLDAVCRDHEQLLILDLAGLSFADCGGLRELVRFRREAGNRPVLAAPQPRVARMLDLTGATACLPVYESVAAARRYCTPTLG